MFDKELLVLFVLRNVVCDVLENYLYIDDFAHDIGSANEFHSPLPCNPVYPGRHTLCTLLYVCTYLSLTHENLNLPIVK